MTGTTAPLTADFAARRLLSDAQSLALLRHAYRQIYRPAFPIDDERESLATFETALMQPGPLVHYIITVAGRDLGTPDRWQPVSIGVANYYPQQEVGLLAYVATDPESRRLGLAKHLLARLCHDMHDHARQLGKPLRAIFGEVNDPDRIAAGEDSFDPRTRLEIYQRWGYRVAPIDYVQPALEPGRQKFSQLKLLLIPHPVTGRHGDASDIARFLEGIYTELGVDIASDPDYAAMIRQLGQLDR